MKKYISILFVVLLVMSLTACASHSEELQSTQNEASTIPDYCLPNNETIYRYQSYDEMISELQTAKEPSQYGARYQTFLEEFQSGTLEILYPMQDNAPMELDKDWHTITLHTSDSHRLPWIWYYCIYDGMGVAVCISYPNIIEGFEMAESDTYLDIQKVLSPQYPVPGITEAPSEVFDALYEKQLVLADNKKVQAVVRDYHEIDKVYYNFRYDDMFVSVWRYEGDLPETFWSEFSLQPYEQAQTEPIPTEE